MLDQHPFCRLLVVVVNQSLSQTSGSSLANAFNKKASGTVYFDCHVGAKEVRVNFDSSDIPERHNVFVKTNEEPISFFGDDGFVLKVHSNVPRSEQMPEFARCD